MKFNINTGPLLCQSCGEEAVAEHDLYTGDLPDKSMRGPAGLDQYRSDDPMLSSPDFFPATALCAFCLMMTVPTTPGPWYDVGVQGQS